MATQRLSALQKNTLFLLYGIHQRQGVSPVPGRKLLAIINKNSGTGVNVHSNNFNASCRTLSRHGIISIFRERIYLAFQLTEAGLTLAQEMFSDNECR